jgi:hypothetical protein
MVLMDTFICLIIVSLWNAQRQSLQARRASRRHEPFHYTALRRRRSEGSETGGVIFRRQLSRRLQAHVGREYYIASKSFVRNAISSFGYSCCSLHPGKPPH